MRSPRELVSIARNKVRNVRRRPDHRNEPLDLRCFTRGRLTISAQEFQQRLDEFKDLQAQSDPAGDYRNAFYFQFPCRFDGLGAVKEYYNTAPIRSIELMNLISEHIEFDEKDVLALGCHNGAELYWLYDSTNALRIHGVDENHHFRGFIAFLSEAFALDDRIVFTQAEAFDFLEKSAERYDVIICHGLLYMTWDPFLFLRALRSRLADDGVCSIEVYTLKDDGPVMKYLGDGSGWGDTFGFTESFLRAILPNFGLHIDNVLDYRGRRVFLCRRGPLSANLAGWTQESEERGRDVTRKTSSLEAPRTVPPLGDDSGRTRVSANIERNDRNLA